MEKKSITIAWRASFVVVALLASCSGSSYQNEQSAIESEPVAQAGEQRYENLRVVSRVNEAAEVYRALITAPDAQIPENLLRNSECVAVLPRVLRAAFIAGGRYGLGIVSCNSEGQVWSPPSFVTLSGGSVGFQIGAESADLVLFFTGSGAKNSLLSSSITLGADITVAAGPVGRTAQGKTDFSQTAIYTYAATEGIFAGISLEGAVLQPDYDANAAYYGQALNLESLFSGGVVTNVPSEAREFVALLP